MPECFSDPCPTRLPLVPDASVFDARDADRFRLQGVEPMSSFRSPPVPTMSTEREAVVVDGEETIARSIFSACDRYFDFEQTPSAGPGGGDLLWCRYDFFFTFICILYTFTAPVWTAIGRRLTASNVLRWSLTTVTARPSSPWVRFVIIWQAVPGDSPRNCQSPVSVRCFTLSA